MRLSLLTVVVAACLMCSLPPGATAGTVSLSIANGRVTLIALDATPKQILTEWARVGQTRIVNLERVPGGPVSLELTNVSEADALGIILRSVGGFMAAPRVVADGRLSQFDRIVVMAVLATAVTQSPPVPLPQRSTEPGLQGLRRGTSPGREGYMGMPRRSEDNQVDPDDQDDEAMQDGDLSRDPRRPPFSRPPIAAPPMVGGSTTQSGGQNAGDAATAPLVFQVPGVLTPGSSAARPGQTVPAAQAPRKPPG